jgi:sulfatase maturation enzyme AslB (radical SAM superfamily)
MNLAVRPQSPNTSSSSFDDDLLQEIADLGMHPFILLRVGGKRRRLRFFSVCKTQNDAGTFVNDLASLSGFADSKLVRGIERALRLETYEAAELLFSWVSAPPGPVSETVYFHQADNLLVYDNYDYPAYGYDCVAEPHGLEQRTAMLLKTLETYVRCDGNDGIRFSLIEALAFGLSRVLGSQRRYTEALAAVNKALAFTPYSIHLKAAKHTLLLKLDGKSVPGRLEKFVGEDNGYLKQFVCPLPFERFDIGPNGDVLVCCGHWLPTSIGNFMTDSVEDVLNSDSAQKIRGSMTDGSYKYCNHLECGSMAQETLPRREELTVERTRNAVSSMNYRLDGVDEIMFAFDQTCNLSCPSCRTHRIVEKASQSADKARAVEQKLLPLLPTAKVLHINPAGEIFASKPSRRLLELINNDTCPDLRLRIISNGTLFTEEEWNKFPGIHNKVESIRVSIDATSKQTFEKLRRLGKYESFLSNMRFLRKLRMEGVVPQLKFSFTYQLDNFREMPAFVAFGEEMRADFVIFERLQNIAFSHAEFRKKAVHYPDHSLYGEFIDVIKNPLFRQQRVFHDFDYDGVENITREEARARLIEMGTGTEQKIAVLA